MSEISGASIAAAPSRSRRLLAAAIAVAVVAALTAATYAGYTLTKAATPVVTIGCYETDSLTANTAVIRPGTGSPVAACADTYASAFPGSPRPAQFAACVLPSGAVGVFPSEASGDTCKRLGLSPVAGKRATQHGSK